jgi:hypothetical protein
MTTEADGEIDADRGAAKKNGPTPQEAKWLTFVAMLLRPHWLLMVIFARVELVQRFVGRKRSRGWSPHQVGDTESSGMVLTERAPEEIINQIGVDGVANGLRLSEEAVANVLSFAAHTPCYGNRAPDFPLEYDRFAYPIPAGAIVGDYLDGVTDCDVIRRLWQDPIIIAIAGGYLGRRPLPIKVRLWWSFSSNHASPELLAAHAQDRFHFDLDNWRAIKFFST